MTFAGFDDYWAPFLCGVAPSMSYAGTLGDEQRETLKQRLRQKIDVEPGPSHRLSRAGSRRGRDHATLTGIGNLPRLEALLDA